MAKSSAQTRLGRTKKIALLALMLALTIIFCFVPIQFGTITLALMILPTLILAQVCDFKTSLFMGVLMGLINYIAWFTTKAASPIAPIFQNPLVCIVPRILIAVVAYWSRVGLEKLLLEKWLKIKPSLKKGDAIDEDEEHEISNVEFEPNRQCDEVENTLLDAQIQGDKDDCTEDEIIPQQSKKDKAKEIAVREAIHLVSTALGVITNTLFVAIFTLIFFNNTTLGNTIIDVEYILAWFGFNFAIEVVAFSLITPPIATAIKAAKLV
jgi:uncharacterized membrane protein